MATPKKAAGKAVKPTPAVTPAVNAAASSALAIFDRFKQISELKPLPITCEGWGLVYVKPMSLAAAEAAQAKDPEPTKDTLAKGVIHSMCDVNGDLVFDIGNPDHLKLVQAQPQTYLLDFMSKAGKALGTGQEGADDAKKA